MAASSIIGTIAIGLTANTGAFTSKLRAAAVEVRGLGGHAASAAAGVGKLVGKLGSAGGPAIKGFLGNTLSLNAGLAALGGVLTAGALVNGLKNIVTGSLDAIDSTSEMAQQLGITAGQLQALRYATQQTGGDAEGLDSALQKLNVELGQAAANGGPAAEALKRLGLDAGDLANMDVASAFKAIAGGFSEIQNPAEQAALVFAIFGRNGVGLLNTLNAGATGLEVLEKRAAKLGVSLSAIDEAKVGAAKNKLDEAGLVIEGLGNRLAVELSPFIEAAADQLIKLAASGVDAGSLVSRGLSAVATVAGLVADTVQYLDLAFKGAQLGITGSIEAILYGFARIAASIQGLRNSVFPGFAKPLDDSLGEMARGMSTLVDSQLADFRAAMAAPPASNKIHAFFDGIQSGAAKAAAAIGQATSKNRELSDSFLKTTADVAELTAKLREQVDTFGLQGAAADIAKLKAAGATDAQLAEATDLAAQLHDKEEDKKAADERKKEAGQLKVANFSPVEKFSNEVAKLDSLFAEGLIDGGTFARAFQSAAGELQKGEGGASGGGPRLAGALELGSQAARSAILAARGVGSGDPIRDVARTVRDQLAEQRRSASALERILSLAGKGGEVLALPGVG